MFPGGGVEGHRHHRTADAHHIRTGLWFATGVTDMSCSMNPWCFRLPTFSIIRSHVRLLLTRSATAVFLRASGSSTPSVCQYPPTI